MTFFFAGQSIRYRFSKKKKKFSIINGKEIFQFDAIQDTYFLVINKHGIGMYYILYISLTIK